MGRDTSSSKGKHLDVDRVEQLGIYEAALPGPGSGHPFIDHSLRVTFRRGGRTIAAEGFYDGRRTWRIRCTPDLPGDWEWRTESNEPELDGKTGHFVCTAAEHDNHGPVSPTNRWHFC